MSRAKRYLVEVAIALGEIVGFAVVLALSTIAFSMAHRWLSAESFESGEPPGKYFYVAVSTRHAGQPFELVPFAEASHSTASLMLMKSDLVVKTGELSTIQYHVIEKTPGASTIETVYSNDDYTFTSRYRVEGQRIVPLRHLISGPGNGMIGLLLALIFTTLLFYMLRAKFKRKANQNSVP